MQLYTNYKIKEIQANKHINEWSLKLETDSDRMHDERIPKVVYTHTVRGKGGKQKRINIW